MSRPGKAKPPPGNVQRITSLPAPSAHSSATGTPDRSSLPQAGDVQSSFPAASATVSRHRPPGRSQAANHRDVGWQTESPDAAGGTDVRPRAAVRRFADAKTRDQRHWSGSAAALPAIFLCGCIARQIQVAHQICCMSRSLLKINTQPHFMERTGAQK